MNRSEPIGWFEILIIALALASAFSAFLFNKQGRMTRGTIVVMSALFVVFVWLLWLYVTLQDRSLALVSALCLGALSLAHLTYNAILYFALPRIRKWEDRRPWGKRVRAQEDTMFPKWISQDGTVGTVGPDDGETLRNQELPGVGAVVIEKKIRADKPATYFAVTVAVFGRFVNTSYYHDIRDAEEHADSCKLLLQAVVTPSD